MRTTALLIILLVSAIASFGQTEAILIKRVDSLSLLKEMNKDDTSFIRTTAEKILILQPKNSKAYLLLSRVAVLNSRFDEALSYVNYAIIFNKNYTDAYALRAPLLMYYQRIPEALDDYNTVINNKGGKATTYYERGYLLVAYQKYEQALQDFVQAIKLDSTQAIYYSRAAAMSLNTGRKEDALRYSTKSIQLDNTDYEPFSLRGQVYFDKKEWELCCADFRMSLARIPDDTEDDHAIRSRTAMLHRSSYYCDTSAWTYYYLRATNYYETNEPDKAIEWYEKGAKKFPSNYSIAYWLANSWNSKGDYNKAEVYFSKSIALKDNLIKEMEMISDFKDEAERKEYMMQVIAKNYQSRAEARYRLGNYTGALADLNVVIDTRQKDDNLYWYYNLKGVFYQAMNDFTTAITWFDKSLGLNPDYAECLVNRAECKMYDVAKKNNPGITIINDITQIQLISKGTAAEKNILGSALVDCNKAIVKTPDLGRTYYVRGVIKLMLEQSDYCYDFLKAKQLGYADGMALMEQVNCK